MGTATARRVALVGGGFSTDEDGLLDDWLLTHARRPRPKVCFVPTASGDAPAYIDRFLHAFTSRDCEPSVLPLFRRELDDESLRTFLLAQDVVYVGGGNTANLLAVWRATESTGCCARPTHTARCCAASAPAPTAGPTARTRTPSAH